MYQSLGNFMSNKNIYKLQYISRLVHNEYTCACNRGLKKSLEMNIAHITQIINMNSRIKLMNRFAQTFDGVMKTNSQNYEKFK